MANLMTLREAADQLGRSPDTLKRQLQRGVMKGMKLGPLWLVTPAEVERYRRRHLRVRKAERDHDEPD